MEHARGASHRCRSYIPVQRHHHGRCAWLEHLTAYLREATFDTHRSPTLMHVSSSTAAQVADHSGVALLAVFHVDIKCWPTRRAGCADDSTSMKYADHGTRISDLNNILARVAEVACLFDNDGISVRAINRRPLRTTLWKGA